MSMTFRTCVPQPCCQLPPARHQVLCAAVLQCRHAWKLQTAGANLAQSLGALGVGATYVEFVTVASMRNSTDCIFDMDGLLLDTEGFYTIVQEAIAARFGKTFTWELKSKMMGKKALEAAQTFVLELGLEGQLTPEQLLVEREAALDAMFPTAQLLPGVERLLQHLRAHGVPCALATSSHARHFELKTTQHRQLFNTIFEHRITGCQVTNGKPAPEIFFTAAQRWEPPPPPSSCLVFEDAPSGVEAAVAAGMRVVMVPDSRLSPELTAGADEVLRSLQEFRPERWGLPPFPLE